MAAIQASVGNQGRNLSADVLDVQALLKANGCDPGVVDGLCGAKTIAAIVTFQRASLITADGLIEPGRATWLKLSGTTAPPPAPPAGTWSGDSAKWTHRKKLESMHPDLRPKVEAMLDALRIRAYQPKIFYGWRSVAVQLELYNQGNSKVKFSFHNAQNVDGTPNAYAADIIDERYAWSPQAEASGFWKALGEEAKKQSLFWGGDWSGFRDWAHVQLVANDELARVKRESGL
ncbi:MAG: peptidoglycan-binding domain 1 protein [Betaproteobacteria bacterium]|jgi:peptidoglycan hydrolase-like protein with peptidoglycan-binding domain|nr:peptidoglycan-binding domain 1 protein [Betaproteobacteria bacterium]